MADIGNWEATAVDAVNNRIAALVFQSGPDVFRLYDISNLSAPPVLLDSKTNTISHANQTIGYMDFGGGTNLYIHDMNNGLLTSRSIRLPGGAHHRCSGPPLPPSASSPARVGVMRSWPRTQRLTNGRRTAATSRAPQRAAYVIPSAAASDSGTYTVWLVIRAVMSPPIRWF